MARKATVQYLAFSWRGAGYEGSPMPIRVLLRGDVRFDPEDIEKLAAAFELL